MRSVKIALTVLFTFLLFCGYAEAHSKNVLVLNKARNYPSEDARLRFLLKGSFKKLVWQNDIVDFVYRLPRVANYAELQEYIEEGKIVGDELIKLVRVPDETENFKIDPKEVKPEFRYILPSVAIFIQDFTAVLQERFRKLNIPEELRITSLIRTEEHHLKEVVKAKKTSADCHVRERCTAHTAGIAFDLTRRGLSPRALRIIRQELVCLYIEKGIIQGIEEEKGNHFHIVVYPSYSSYPVCSYDTAPKSVAKQNLKTKKKPR